MRGGGAPPSRDTQQQGGGGEARSSSGLTDLLSKTTTTWAAAVSGSQTAASLELSTGKSVIAIGGFSGADDAPTLEQFKEWVAEGTIAYGEIQSWVEANHTATTAGSSTVYDLTT
ncbi:hypothetical protein ACGFIF_12670 [Kribbella sp. NPDC049174]|uniref:hypothetical protein n=1 Tax=Kribbella sp. NPDC049174 TaxID=3364112 RepID=UPI00371F4475